MVHFKTSPSAKPTSTKLSFAVMLLDVTLIVPVKVVLIAIVDNSILILDALACIVSATVPTFSTLFAT